MPHAGPNSHICQRSLKKYKYELTEEYSFPTGIDLPADVETDLGFAKMTAQGQLTLKKGYVWDGVTRGPDFNSMMRGSLVHDGLYQLISTNRIDRHHKGAADRLFQRIIRNDGLPRVAAWVAYQAVRYGGKANSRSPDAETANP
jgi:hypothetical protein